MIWWHVGLIILAVLFLPLWIYWIKNWWQLVIEAWNS